MDSETGKFALGSSVIREWVLVQCRTPGTTYEATPQCHKGWGQRELENRAWCTRNNKCRTHENGGLQQPSVWNRQKSSYQNCNSRSGLEKHVEWLSVWDLSVWPELSEHFVLQIRLTLRAAVELYLLSDNKNFGYTDQVSTKAWSSGRAYHHQPSILATHCPGDLMMQLSIFQTNLCIDLWISGFRVWRDKLLRYYSEFCSLCFLLVLFLQLARLMVYSCLCSFLQGWEQKLLEGKICLAPGKADIYCKAGKEGREYLGARAEGSGQCPHTQ